MEYLKLFENHTQYESFVGGGMLRPNVSHCVSENDVHYNPFSWAEEYLTFVAKENCTFTFTQRNGYAISYSIDNGKTWEVPASTTHQTVSAGSKVIWKSADIMNTTNSTNGGLLRVGSTGGIGTFASTGHFEVQGNIMSLIRGDSFANADELINGKEFIELFKGCTGLTSAENLILPATTLIDNCYYYMFDGCTSLNYIKTMFTTTPSGSSPNYYTTDWVNGVAASGTFVKNSAATWTTTGVNGIPEGWTIETVTA